jgi:cation diffusion facilitator CzcD-associated flavoprotein CzcO
LGHIRITGRGGQSLHEQWAGEPRAFLGISVPQFPNFFMLYGPGTNGGELVSTLEAQAEYAVRAVKRMTREQVSAIEVKPLYEAIWNAWLQSKMEGTSWTMSNNYFKSATGKVVTQWPSGNMVYRLLTKIFGRISERTNCRAA